MAKKTNNKEEVEKESKGIFGLFKKKSSPGSSKASSAKATAKATAPEVGIQGFLVPRHFRQLNKYKNSPIYRSTSLIVVICLIAIGFQVYKYTLTRNNVRIATLTQEMEAEESAKLQQQAASLRPVKSKFKELEVLRKQLRLPMAPVLDTIEKTIPPEISINRITWVCPPIAAAGSLRRKASIQIDVYFPPEVDPNDKNIMRWSESMRERIKEAGLVITQADWGPVKRFEPTKEQEIRAQGEFGTTKQLSLSVELGDT